MAAPHHPRWCLELWEAWPGSQAPLQQRQIAAWLPGAPGRGSAGTRGGQGAPACAGRQPLTSPTPPPRSAGVGTGASCGPGPRPSSAPPPRSGPRPEERRLPPGPQGTQALMVGRPDLRPETGTEGASDCADGETGSGKVWMEPLTVHGETEAQGKAFQGPGPITVRTLTGCRQDSPSGGEETIWSPAGPSGYEDAVSCVRLSLEDCLKKICL